MISDILKGKDIKVPKYDKMREKEIEKYDIDSSLE